MSVISEVLEKIKKQDRSQQRGHEVEAGRRDAVQILGDEPPQHNVNGDPREDRYPAGRGAAKQVKIPQHDGDDGAEISSG